MGEERVSEQTNVNVVHLSIVRVRTPAVPTREKRVAGPERIFV